MPETPKGLATVAYLKTRLDEHKDHLSLFEPLVADALRHITVNDFAAADVKEVLFERTGILLPSDTLQTVLGRFVPKMLKRAGGRYFRAAEPVPEFNFEKDHAVISAAQKGLAAELVAFAASEGTTFESQDDALAALAVFVSDNKVNLVLRRPLPESPLERSSQSRKITRVIARFITHRCLESEVLSKALDDLVEGMIIEDTLLLTDIQRASQLFGNLTVVLDTPLLFPAIQMAGAAASAAVAEGLHLLREAGARTVVFDITVDEMRRILSVYEDKLATSAGRLSLYPTDLSRYVLRARLTPADIRIVSSTLEERLRKAGVAIRQLPKHDRRYTLDEEALAACLVDQRDKDPESPRIRHDVDCIAGVLTLRSGRVASSIERSVAVFVTTSGRVIRNAQQWYFSQREGGMPPIIHHLALTSIAWLKKPAAAPLVKVHELAAICAAALRPTRETWGKVLTTLRALSAEGVINNDEAVAVVVSELVEPTLARIDEEADPDADSITEAIDRVRDMYRAEASVEANERVESARAELEATRRAAEESIGAAAAEARVAQEAAAAALSRTENVLTTMRGRVARVAGIVVSVVFYSAAVVLAAAGVLSIPGVFDAAGGALKIVARVVLGAGAIFGAYGAIQGGNLADLRARLTKRIETSLAARWLDEPPS